MPSLGILISTILCNENENCAKVLFVCLQSARHATRALGAQASPPPHTAPLVLSTRLASARAVAVAVDARRRAERAAHLRTARPPENRFDSIPFHRSSSLSLSLFSSLSTRPSPLAPPRPSLHLLFSHSALCDVRSRRAFFPLHTHTLYTVYALYSLLCNARSSTMHISSTCRTRYV